MMDADDYAHTEDFDLAATVDGSLGLQGTGAVLASLGVCTYEQLGALSEDHWQSLLPYLRLEPQDLCRLDRLRRRAARSRRARKRAAEGPWASASDSFRETRLEPTISLSLSMQATFGSTQESTDSMGLSLGDEADYGDPGDAGGSGDAGTPDPGHAGSGCEGGGPSAASASRQAGSSSGGNRGCHYYCWAGPAGGDAGGSGIGAIVLPLCLEESPPTKRRREGEGGTVVEIGAASASTNPPSASATELDTESETEIEPSSPSDEQQGSANADVRADFAEMPSECRKLFSYR
eukprot:gnl/TRDRNA2_/TRDRNA2_190302_c0_seq1.p1 gnl/TRDRNA2_/TRDRNA2_190302_c0~~gnl/TRDRNA2_/TRDRNA2_190302_c0_seq1.p1  ORF type:complete len:292 (-),score=37.94 gnl/TRDRNA2_/TRDRNA2_190302_c0_seq1:200-1075(-)